MKRNSSVLLGVLCTALLLLSASHALAQANAKPPTQLTYQGFLTDANGVPFGNTAPVNKTVIFRIYDVLSGGTTANLKWSSQQVVTVDKGYFSALLGQGSAGPEGDAYFKADLTGVFAGSSTVSDRYLELTADGTTIAPRLRFLPAPYAVLAKSATDLVDPVTGASSLSIADGNLNVGGSLNVSSVTASGNLSVSGITASGSITANGNLSAANLSGNGANLTSLNASQITSGTLANARTTATSANTANAIVARDGSGSITVGHASLTGDFRMNNDRVFYAKNFAGVEEPFLWPRHADNTTYLNYGSSGFHIRNNSSTTTMFMKDNGNVGIGTTTPTAKLEVTGGVVANSFKITGTPTLVLYNISRFSMLNPVPPTGVTQSVSSGAVGRNSSGYSTDWYKSTYTSWGVVAYACTFVVPAGEVWEVNYHCNARWSTDDSAGLVWTVNDVLTDDSSATLGTRGNAQGQMYAGQNFILSAGTSVVRVKIGVGGGSGSDDIEFPYRNPSYCVVKKYKSN